MDDFEDVPTYPPDAHEWEYRRRKYDAIWLSCIGESVARTNDHVGGLKLELERSFCSGSWIACIMLAAAIVEVHLSYLDKWKNSERDAAIDALNIKNDWVWLRNRRNNLIHGKVGSEDSRLSATEYANCRDDLQRDAQTAIRIALWVSLNDLLLS